MKKTSVILWWIILAGTLYHAMFFSLNDVLKVADSFAYLQMSHFLWSFSQQGLGNGWFGFVYSLPITITNLFIGNDFLSAKITNLLLMSISAILLWKISRKILAASYSFLVIILLYLSPTLLHFNIHVLSENIYIPLFLWLFLMSLDFSKKIITWNSHLYKETIAIALLIGLMYLTRAEAFIYIASIWIISITFLIQKKLNFWKFFKYWTLFFVSFFIFISPYLVHLHSLSGDWGLTNKGASNLRQAELRGQEKMDDAGFEKAVAELTEDKHHLIAGFAGGMPYDRPQIEWSLGAFIMKDPADFGMRVLKNQWKLYSYNFPEIILGKSPKLYNSEDPRFKNNHIFLFLIFVPLVIILIWIYHLYKKERTFLFLSVSFFIPACIFFTLFFTLNRYFLIFLPLLLIIFVYGVSQIRVNYIKAFSIASYIAVLLLSTSVYYNVESPKDEYYALKKEAGEWLQQSYAGEENNSRLASLKIMERFPIVTYYSGSKTRYITPYSDNFEDILEYGNYNNIDILVVDSMDFNTYRPTLSYALTETPEWFEKLKEFTNQKNQKVILYLLKKS